MIDDAEKKDSLKKIRLLLSQLSGNTGIALAFVTAAKGYRLILTMPETFSIERRKILKAIGAELVLDRRIQRNERRYCKSRRACMPQPRIHSCLSNSKIPLIRKFIAKLPLKKYGKTPMAKSIFLSAGVGTGGTITGVGEVLKKRNPRVKIIAVEPEKSPVLSGGDSQVRTKSRESEQDLFLMC